MIKLLNDLVLLHNNSKDLDPSYNTETELDFCIVVEEKKTFITEEIRYLVFIFISFENTH